MQSPPLESGEAPSGVKGVSGQDFPGGAPVDPRVSRRDFLAGSAAGIGLLAAGRQEAATFKTALHKAVIVAAPNEENLKPVRDAGFEGVEARPAGPEEAAKAREIAGRLGLRIHSVIGGGSPEGLRAARAYGADAVLLVPGGVNAKPMPEPWEFDVEFDPKTGHLARVVRGDNEKYKAYIEAHNRSMDASRERVRKLIPVAEETKVVIALENVWNNFCVKPPLLKWLVASFQSPWVKAYFDVGNHVKYLVPPEQWIRELGPLLAKVHVKDYRLKADNRGGDWAGIGEGSVDWPAVRQALEGAGYNGWLTDESGSFPLPELGRRFDLIIAGKNPGSRRK